MYKNKKLDHHELLDDRHCLSIYNSSSHMVVSFCETKDRLHIYSGGQSTQIKYLSKSTDTYNKILLQ